MNYLSFVPIIFVHKEKAFVLLLSVFFNVITLWKSGAFVKKLTDYKKHVP
jgi:hypothetical protein